MSFSAIRSIATSSLTTTQVQMSVTSANIANADTAGYSRKVASQVSTTTSAAASGVAITTVTSTVDAYLLKDLVAAAGTLAAATTTQSYADKTQQALGSTTGGSSGGTSLANTIATLETALTSLTGTPESQTLQSQTVDALDSLASQLRETSASIQGLRGDADEELETTIDTANTALADIASLNKQISATQGRGESTADLEDKRNTALQTLSTQVGVKYYTTADNQMRIYTSGGTPLLDSSVHKLAYSSAASVGAETVFGAVSVDGKDVTTELTSGKAGALIAQRDTELPAAQAALDELATTLMASLNSVHNAGASLPPLATLTGTTTVSSGEALSASGTVRIALTNSTGALTGYQDFDLSSYATVGDFAAAVDAMSGLSASVDGSGKLVIKADSASNGVAIADLDSSVGTDGQGVSDYFGLNDLMVGTSAANIAVRSDILKKPGLLATSALSTAASLTAGSTVVGVGQSDIAAQLSSALGGDQNFAAAGKLKASTGSFADYAGDIIGNLSTAASRASTELDNQTSSQQALQDSMSSQSGVNLDEETARLSALEQQYSTAAQLLKTLQSMFDALTTAVQ